MTILLEHVEMQRKKLLGLLHLSFEELLRDAREVAFHLVDIVDMQKQELTVLQTLHVVASLAHVLLAIGGRVDFDQLILVEQQLGMQYHCVFEPEVLKYFRLVVINLLLLSTFCALTPLLLCLIVLFWFYDCKKLTCLSHQEGRYSLCLIVKILCNVTLCVYILLLG